MKTKLLTIIAAALMLVITSCAREGPQTSDETAELTVTYTQKMIDTSSDEKTSTKEKISTEEKTSAEIKPTETYTTEGEEIIPELENRERAKSMIDSMTLNEKIAQLFVITPEVLAGDSDTAQAGDISHEAFNKFPVGGIVYFKNNLQNPNQTRELLASYQSFSRERLNLSVFNCVDEEGGIVARIAGSSAFEVENIGNMADIGASGDFSLAYEAGRTIGSYLSDLGFNIDFAPVADVLTNPENNVIGERSFGSDPDIVAHMVISQLEGLNECGVKGVVKHFPGHGATAEDTHIGEARTNSTLEEMLVSELIPFQEAIDAGVGAIMIGHFTAPHVTGDNTPCSLSEVIITDILRGQMNYDGIVITDALNMGAVTEHYDSAEAAVKALEAGADLLLMPEDFYEAYEGVLQAVRSGRLSEERINESLMRIISLKLTMEQE